VDESKPKAEINTTKKGGGGGVGVGRGGEGGGPIKKTS